MLTRRHISFTAFITLFFLAIWAADAWARPAPTPTPQPGAAFTIDYRQGNSPTVWASDGFNNYPVVGTVVTQIGAAHIAHGQAYAIITFPSSYSNAPLVYVTGIGADKIHLTTVSPVNFMVELDNPEPAGSDVVFNWLAIGQ